MYCFLPTGSDRQTSDALPLPVLPPSVGVLLLLVLYCPAAGPQYRLLGAVLWAPLCGAGHALHEALQPGQYMRALLLETGLLDPSPAVHHQQGAVQLPASGGSRGSTVEAAGAEAAAAALKEATGAAAAAAGGDGGAAAGVGSMEEGGDTLLNNSSSASSSSSDSRPWWHELLPTHMQQQQQAPSPTPASSSGLEAGQSTPGQPRTVNSLTKRELRLFAEEIKQREMAALHAAWREEEAAARRAEAVALAESYKQKQQQQKQGEGEQGAGGAAGGSSRRPWWRLW